VVVTVLDAALVPIIFSIIAIFMSPDQRKQLEGQRKKVHLALREAQPSLKQLSKRGISEFEDHRARLPGREQQRRLPRGQRRGGRRRH